MARTNSDEPLTANQQVADRHFWSAECIECGRPFFTGDPMFYAGSDRAGDALVVCKDCRPTTVAVAADIEAQVRGWYGFQGGER